MKKTGWLLAGALAGMLTGAVALGVAELAAGITGPPGSPVTAVGGVAINHTPVPVKEFAITHFGTHDKTILLAGILVILAAFAAVIGIVSLRWLAAGFCGLAVFGAVGVTAALSRPAATTADALPTVAGVLAAAVALRFLARAARRPTAPPTLATGPASPAGPITGRRGFLIASAAAAAVAAAGGVAGNALLGRFNVDSARSRIKLPAPAVPAPAAPACVSNEVGGSYNGNARWLGVPLAGLLRRAGIRAGADQVLSTAADGMTISTPVEAILDGRDALLAVGMNHQPLPVAHGFPARMVVPGLYGYVSATKWVTRLTLTTFAARQAYWTQRGYAAQAPVKTESRIDVPRPLAQVRAGLVPVAGVAWAPATGIAKVEVSVDSGPWQPARLAAADGIDTWRQWSWAWHAAPGLHQLQVRATDNAGRTQVSRRAQPFPDGASGWESVVVTVT